MKNTGKLLKQSKVDWFATIVPLVVIGALGALFIVYPNRSNQILEQIRGFLGNEMGLYYLLLGILAFGTTLFMAFSKFGKIKLGNVDKPAYPSFAWGCMIFTATMAADILFYSLSEWAMYMNEEHLYALGGTPELWGATFPLFHWGPIAWSFYIVLAVAFGFMLHIRGRTKQKFSEACRPLFGDKIDGPVGKVIDLFAIFALLAGTATTFSMATPLLTQAITRIFGLDLAAAALMVLTIVILLIVALVYTIAVLSGMKGISKLANISVYVFFAFLIYILVGGGETRFILETGVSALGNMAQNFIGLATYTAPARGAEAAFPQTWTIFYWAYWMAWCVATPFFIGLISKGRTIKNTVVGAYLWGLAGTFTSFIILGNYGLAQQVRGGLDTVGAIFDEDPVSYEAVVRIFDALPLPALGLALLVVCIVLFYASTFDVITLVVSKYSYKTLNPGELPGKGIRAFWSAVFIILPIALLFSERSLENLQTVAIIAAFPIGIIVTLIVVSFFKDAKKYLDGE